MPTFTPQACMAALRILLSRTETTRQFLDAVEKGDITFSELPARSETSSRAHHGHAKLPMRAKALLAKGGGLPNADRQKVIDEFAVRCIKKTGDAARQGRLQEPVPDVPHAHRRRDQDRPRPDRHGRPSEGATCSIDILDPSRSVEGNFRVYTVDRPRRPDLQRPAGRRRRRRPIELIDAEGKKHTVLRDDIENCMPRPSR